MLRTIGSRLLLLIPTLFGLSILLFLWVRALPGGPAVALLGERATPEAVERINELYGFNEPILEQYFTWLGQLLSGDFGTSLETEPTRSRGVHAASSRRRSSWRSRRSSSRWAFGIPLGYLAARRHGRSPTTPRSSRVSLGITIPVFFLAFMLKYVFAVQLGWLPSDGRQDPRIDATHYDRLLRARRHPHRASGMPRGTPSCT